MLNAKDIRHEVLALVRDNLEREEPMPADWLVHAIVGGHDEIEGPDAEWHAVTAFMAIRSEVRHSLHLCAESPPRMRRAAGQDFDDEAQGELFDRLQPAYLVKRGKQMWLVPLSKMTDEELTAKADEYDRFGRGAMQHANQLRRYRDTR